MEFIDWLAAFFHHWVWAAAFMYLLFLFGYWAGRLGS